VANLALLQPDVRVAARFIGALAGAHTIVVYPSRCALESSLESGEVDVCVLDAADLGLDGIAERLTSLRGCFPNIAIVASVESEGGEGYFDLGGLGVDGGVVGSSRPVKLRAGIDTALAVARARHIERVLKTRIAEPGPAVVAWAVEHEGGDTSVERLASSLGHSPPGLREVMAEIGLPSPARILLWGRLLLAGARLGDDGRRVEDVAFSLGYTTSTALSRAMKRHTGLTPAEVSRRGGLSVVLDALFPAPIS